MAGHAEIALTAVSHTLALRLDDGSDDWLDGAEPMPLDLSLKDDSLFVTLVIPGAVLGAEHRKDGDQQRRVAPATKPIAIPRLGSHGPATEVHRRAPRRRWRWSSCQPSAVRRASPQEPKLWWQLLGRVRPRMLGL